MGGGDYHSINLDTVVCIDDWTALDEELAGSRVKRTVAEPETDDLYVFKESKERREAQIWSELIASFIAGDLQQKSTFSSRPKKTRKIDGIAW